VSDAAAPKVSALGGGRYSLVDGEHRRTAYAARASGTTWVFIDGQVYVIQAQTPGRRGVSHGDDDTALSAPMPATVVSVHVAEGQNVARGDVLITLEAMKMEIAIRAPRDAVVRRVQCRPGELVQPGVALLEME
jgi:3-methylcrotonyl-CoA carboxylase alpha subunit